MRHWPGTKSMLVLLGSSESQLFWLVEWGLQYALAQYHSQSNWLIFQIPNFYFACRVLGRSPCTWKFISKLMLSVNNNNNMDKNKFNRLKYNEFHIFTAKEKGRSRMTWRRGEAVNWRKEQIDTLLGVTLHRWLGIEMVGRCLFVAYNIPW